MLLNKHAWSYEAKRDWYPRKVYLHFDGPAKRSVAECLVKDPQAISKHAFLPLISFDKRERRFRRTKGSAPKIEIKVRRLAYPSNMDSCIFSYYASLLNDPYERLIKALNIDDCVIGYRKIGSNIDLALSAFSEIRSRGSCVAFAFDVSGFFDNIDHAALLRNWCRVLGTSSLPVGHNKVFQNLTRFTTVDRKSCLGRLGYRKNSRDREIVNRPICGISEFRRIIKGRGDHLPSLLVPWLKDYRIPQGTPLSALAANIAMIDFDIAMNSSVKALGGSYRRYSDDILVIVPTPARASVRILLDENLKHCTRRLRVNEKKTDIVEFIPGALADGKGTKGLQYLGFLFDGDRHLIRPATISKFYRRMHQAVHSAKRQHRKAIKGQIPGRPNLHQRSVLASTTHLGSENFIKSYAAKAMGKLGHTHIKKQLSRHMPKAKKLLSC